MSSSEAIAALRVLVLGSGVIGVCTAYYLARQGHEVTAVDRQRAAALETNFAKAGQVSPGNTGPWAAPGLPLKVLRWESAQVAGESALTGGDPPPARRRPVTLAGADAGQLLRPAPEIEPLDLAVARYGSRVAPALEPRTFERASAT